jgi:hypothetical protein
MSLGRWPTTPAGRQGDIDPRRPNAYDKTMSRMTSAEPGRLPESPATPAGAPAGALPTLASAAGYVLAVSYPVLAFSTGGRAIYQLFFKDGGLLFTGDVHLYLGALLSAVASLCYLLAAIGFAVRRRPAWWLSVYTLGFETVMTLVVGTLTLPFVSTSAVIGGTVWRWYGVDYGFFPLFQPLLGLLWLFWPVTLRAYGIDLHVPWTPWEDDRGVGGGVGAGVGEAGHTPARSNGDASDA